MNSIEITVQAAICKPSIPRTGVPWTVVLMQIMFDRFCEFKGLAQAAQLEINFSTSADSVQTVELELAVRKQIIVKF